MRFTLLPGRYPCVQLWQDDGRPFSAPILPAEAGVFEDQAGFYYYPADVPERIALVA